MHLKEFLAGAAILAASFSSVHAQVIGAIQGSDHQSPYADQSVTVEGVVTLLLEEGFFIQGTPDGNNLTSDGIYVFQRRLPSVSIGNRVSVTGEIDEFIQGNRQNRLPLTEIVDPTITVLAETVDLPSPIVIGSAGRLPPTVIIDDDGLQDFDPENDGIDFYETLEGMRVTIPAAHALSPPSRFDEVWALPESGSIASGFDGQSVIVATQMDANPERILLDLQFVDTPPGTQAGTALGDVTGVLTYGFGSYRVIADSIQEPELFRESHQLSVAVYNVENLDPKVESLVAVGNNKRSIDDDIGDGKFAAIAEQIVKDLGSPEIIALQEVQDSDGAENTSVTSAQITLETLIEAISSAAGPTYNFLDLPPKDDQDGGQPGGNIRVAYLYDSDRVTLVAGSARRIIDLNQSDGDAFLETRKPVFAQFVTDVGVVTVINVHMSSRGGSDPAFGAVQPPVPADAENRIDQSAVVAAEIDSLLKNDPDAQIIVLGDFNAYYFEPELTDLEADNRLKNLWWTLPELERRSYVFEGQAQALDHVLVSKSLSELATLNPKNINAGLLSVASDHDPLLVTISN